MKTLLATPGGHPAPAWSAHRVGFRGFAEPIGPCDTVARPVRRGGHRPARAASPGRGELRAGELAGHTLRAAAAARAPAAARTPLARIYLRTLTWVFTLFNSVRVLSYLPTVWSIHVAGDSSQHSVITWLTWLGANVTMSLWLYENNGRRVNRAVVVNASNAGMCLLTTVAILAQRI